MSPAPSAAPAIVRKRKAPLQPVKMEDIKIEFLDLSCLTVPDGTAIPIKLEGLGGTSPATVLVSPPLTPMEVSIDTGTEGEEEAQGEQVKQPRKRRKLDHLTPEEKSQHRKMMNRMSAQSARDRQKALMHQQEIKIKEMQQKMDAQKKQNIALAVTTKTLVEENKILKEENARLSQRIRDLELKFQSGSVLSGIIKQEKEETSRLDATYEVIAATPSDNVANVIVTAAAASSNGSIPLESAALYAIPLQKGLEEPSQCPQQQQRSQQHSCPLEESAQSQKVTPNQAAILLLLMSYLGIWTHLNSCKSLENSLSKFSAEMMPKPSSVSEKTWSRLKILLHKWLEMNNQMPSKLKVKQEPLSPPPSPVPG